MYNLFALTDQPDARLVRFSLSSDVQSELTNLFKAQEVIFTTGELEELPFDGNYKPDENERLFIDEFDDVGLIEAVVNPLGIHEVTPSPENFSSIKALFSGYKNNTGVTVLIQYFDKRRIISTNGFSIFHSSNVYKKIEGIGLTIDTKLAAIIRNGRLTFHSFHLLRQIFDMSEYYKDATNEGVEEFAENPLFICANKEQLIINSDTWVRRKMWLVEKSEILTKVKIKDIKIVAKDFDIDLNVANEGGVQKIVMPEDKGELKKLLRLLDEDYYKSSLLKKRYLTNSKRVVDT